MAQKNNIKVWRKLILIVWYKIILLIDGTKKNNYGTK
jgi:hypothetical protein